MKTIDTQKRVGLFRHLKSYAYALGLTTLIGLGTRQAAATNNPADVTLFNRYFPKPTYGIVMDADPQHSNYGVASLPFEYGGTNCSAYILGMNNSANSNKVLQGNVVAKRGGLNLGLQATKAFVDGVTTPLEVTASGDLEGKYFGLAAVVNCNDPANSTLGARAMAKGLIGYLSSPSAKWNPIFGLSRDGKVSLDLAYRPSTKTPMMELSKGFKTKAGTFVFGVRAKHYEKEGTLYGAKVLFVYNPQR